ncbi:hypothetical protein [Candidatus Cyanaurora vandensis]|nr:hypothetical protein [Candidatus Cyanaurora vandensis]
MAVGEISKERENEGPYLRQVLWGLPGTETGGGGVTSGKYMGP